MISSYNNCVFNSATALLIASVTCDVNWLHAVSGHVDNLITLSVPIASFQFCPSILEHKHEDVHGLPFEYLLAREPVLC
jgi:hypothetical protein